MTTKQNADALILSFFLQSGLPFIKGILKSAEYPPDFLPLIDEFRQDLVKNCGIDFNIKDGVIRVYHHGTYICMDTIAATGEKVDGGSS